MSGRRSPPSEVVFVAGLPRISTEEFRTIFSNFGTIIACYVIPAKSPGGKASAWCCFSSIDEATWVVDNLNPNEAKGWPGVRTGGDEHDFLKVEFAAGPVGGIAASDEGGETAPNVFVYDLPGDMSKEQFNHIISPYATITSFRVMPEKSPSGKASALCRFSSIDDATWFVENLNGNVAQRMQSPIKVNFARIAPYGSAPGGNGGARSHPYGMSGGSSGGMSEDMGGGCSGMSEGMRGGMSKGMSKCMSCGGYGYSGDMSERQWRELFGSGSDGYRSDSSGDMGEGQSGGNSGGPSGSGYSGGMSKGHSKGMSGGMSQGMSEGQSGGKCGGGRPMISKDEAKWLIHQWAVNFFLTTNLQTKALEHLWDNLFDEQW